MNTDALLKKRILVVDDERDLLMMTVERLKSWGYETRTAASGEEALQIAREQRPDLILLDILMPKMKGRDVYAHLRNHPTTQAIPVIFLTALRLPDHIRAGLNLGAEDYLVKPVDSKALKDRIEACLGRAHGVSARERILVIEDEPEMAELLKLRLESVGFIAETADRGQTGIIRAVNCPPSLVILGFSHGADAYLTKPFDMNELLQTIARLLKQSAIG